MKVVVEIVFDTKERGQLDAITSALAKVELIKREIYPNCRLLSIRLQEREEK